MCVCVHICNYYLNINSLFSYRDLYYYIHVLLDNASRPKVMIVPSSQTVEVTQSVMLIAIASCIGRSIKYTWIRRNQIIRGETKPVLLIDNIEKKSSRFHSYRCNISDEYGNSAVSKSVALFVKSK